MTPELDFPLSELRIRLSHGDSMAGPTGYSIELRGSGEMEYEGHERCEHPGRRTLRVPPEEVLKVFKYAVQLGFYEMDDVCESPEVVVFDEQSGRVVVPPSPYAMATDITAATVAIAVFDLLRKPGLSPADSDRVKAVAGSLLEALKREKLRIDQWREKESTRDAVRVAIHDFLWSEDTGLPVEAYAEPEVGERTESVYRHVYFAYPHLPSPYYGESAVA